MYAFVALYFVCGGRNHTISCITKIAHCRVFCEVQQLCLSIRRNDCAACYLDSLSRHYPRFSADTMAELVDGFALGPHLAKPMYMLSTGSRRKVWLTAAFAAGTPLTLIDQPFAALDAPSIRFLRELLSDAADHAARAWLLADHEAPEGIALKKTIEV